MLYSYGIGDYSNDGHGVCEHYLAEVSDGFSVEQIKTAYEKTKDQLGFGLEDIADDYQSGMSEGEAEKLIEAGFNCPGEWNMEHYDSVAEVVAENIFELWINIFEFMVQKNLPGFTAVEVKTTTPSLFGEWGSLIIQNEHIGYGTMGPG